MSDPKPSERDQELACEATVDVTDCPEWLTDRVEMACAKARAEERAIILAEGDRRLKMEKKDGDLARELPRFLDWIEARGESDE